MGFARASRRTTISSQRTSRGRARKVERSADGSITNGVSLFKAMSQYHVSDFYNQPLDPSEQPLVSVITPVYNGEEFLADCIKSILAQGYQNWDYVIVNNRSTDRTLEIAKSYSDRDPRIRIHDNLNFVPIIQNHNHAIRQISPQSKYCKVVLADDWLFPDCMMKMVSLAERNPSVGLVGAYGLYGDGVRIMWRGVPFPRSVVSGREACRIRLLQGLYPFGSPTATLIRSDFIRKQHDSHATFTERMNSIHLSYLTELIQFGPKCLDASEYENRLADRLSIYYQVFAEGLLQLRGRKYYEFHRDWLSYLGAPLSAPRMLGGFCAIHNTSGRAV